MDDLLSPSALVDEIIGFSFLLDVDHDNVFLSFFPIVAPQQTSDVAPILELPELFMLLTIVEFNQYSLEVLYAVHLTLPYRQLFSH